MLDDLVARGLRRPEFLIVDGAPGLEKALAAVWDGVPVQRCTVHKHRNLLAHAPERLHEEITADYTDMIYAATPRRSRTAARPSSASGGCKHRAVADSLEEAGERLFTFTRLPPSQWKSARTTNAIERLHEEFKRRIKTQTVLPSADTAAMLFWAGTGFYLGLSTTTPTNVGKCPLRRAEHCTWCVCRLGRRTSSRSTCVDTLKAVRAADVRLTPVTSPAPQPATGQNPRGACHAFYSERSTG